MKILSITFLLILSFVKFGKAKNALACEYENTTLSCEPGESILIADANYGRLSNGICENLGPNDTNCITERTREIINGICVDKQKCTLEASNDVYGDPCIGVDKYLQVTYICITKIKRSNHMVEIMEVNNGNETLGVKLLKKLLKKKIDSTTCP